MATYNGGFRLNVPVGHHKVVPFVDGVLGYNHYNYASLLSLVTYSSIVDPKSAVAGALTYGVGGGARYFVGRHWGVEPEVRWQRNRILDTNQIYVKAGIFYQFGSH